MSKITALLPGLCLMGAILADVVLFGGANLIFLGRRLIQLTEYLAFWR